ncbi:MAG: hypothetical protein ACXVJN_05215 [Mucilaginibacter sp.]
MMTNNPVFNQHLHTRLAQKPHQHIVNHVLKNISGMPEYAGYSFGLVFEPGRTPFLEFETVIIEKIILSADVSLFDERGRHFFDDFKAIHFEFYLVNPKGNYDSGNWMLLDLDDLIFYINREQNTKASEQNNFPKLTSCELGSAGFNFISEGRVFRNKYFDTYRGPAFDLHYGDELNELFAIASNGLAFLYRTHDRAIEELELTPNHYYSSQINIYPRFNNAIAEVAGTLYAVWERIAFLFHEFFHLQPNAKMAPSFKRYITDKVKEAKKDSRLQNVDLDWFNLRIIGDHLILEDLRHPTVHYNDNRTPSGTRAVELMKSDMNAQSIEKTKQAWNRELEFLRVELKVFDEAIFHAISLLNNWANSILGKTTGTTI